MDSDFLESNPLNMCNTAALAVCISQKALLSKLFLWNASLLSELEITKWRRPWEWIFYHFLKFVFDLA